MSINNWSEILKSVSKWGPVSAITILLLLMFMGTIPNVLSDTLAAVKQHDAEQQKIVDAIDKIADSQKQAAKLWRLMCLQQARTNEERRACIAE